MQSSKTINSYCICNWFLWTNPNYSYRISVHSHFHSLAMHRLSSFSNIWNSINTGCGLIGVVPIFHVWFHSIWTYRKYWYIQFTPLHWNVTHTHIHTHSFLHAVWCFFFPSFSFCFCFVSKCLNKAEISM